jgi:hypothetical protein
MRSRVCEGQTGLLSVFLYLGFFTFFFTCFKSVFATSARFSSPPENRLAARKRFDNSDVGQFRRVFR